MRRPLRFWPFTVRQLIALTVAVALPTPPRSTANPAGIEGPATEATPTYLPSKASIARRIELDGVEHAATIATPRGGPAGLLRWPVENDNAAMDYPLWDTGIQQ
jgi:hypothetical protein